MWSVYFVLYDNSIFSFCLCHLVLSNKYQFQTLVSLKPLWAYCPERNKSLKKNCSLYMNEAWSTFCFGYVEWLLKYVYISLDFTSIGVASDGSVCFLCICSTLYSHGDPLKFCKAVPQSPRRELEAGWIRKEESSKGRNRERQRS